MSSPLTMPYVAGGRVDASIQFSDDSSNALPKAVDISFIVERVITNAGLAVLLLVRSIVNQSTDAIEILLPQLTVLKLYDGRFTPSIRSDWGLDPPTADSENQYQLYANSDACLPFLSATPFEDRQESRQGFDDDQIELCLQDLMLRMHAQEKAAYATLISLQGANIPRLYGDVRMACDRSLQGSTESQNQRFGQVRGLLMEYIEGFNMEKLCEQVSEQYWAAICKQTMSTLYLMGDMGILNEDARLGNVRVRKRTDDHSSSDAGNEIDHYEPIFIDFGLCYTRSQYGSDADWIEAKRQQDEEIRIGQGLERTLATGLGKWSANGKHLKRAKRDRLPWLFEQTNPYGLPGFPDGENPADRYVPTRKDVEVDVL